MKREALELAGHTLRNSVLTAKQFNDAVNAILILADDWRNWDNAVDSAYARLTTRDRAAARFFMLSFRASRRDYEGVLQLLPSRPNAELSCAELAFGLDAALFSCAAAKGRSPPCR